MLYVHNGECVKKYECPSLSDADRGEYKQLSHLIVCHSMMSR